MSFERVISLTPSLTETIYALSAEEHLVGVTDACDYPIAANKKPHVCSWFSPDLERIRGLRPDLIVGLQTAHGRLAGEFKNLNAEAALFNPATIEEALADMLQLAELLGRQEVGQQLVAGLRHRLDALDDRVRQIPTEKRFTVSRVLDIDEDELIVAGPLSFQYDVIGRAAGINVTSELDGAYPKVSFRRFKEWNPAMIFLCGTDPTYLDHLKRDPEWQDLAAVRNKRLYQFDCGLTCRTSPRIVDMAELLFTTLYGCSSDKGQGLR